MKDRFHGVFSLLLILVAIIMALVYLWGQSVVMGLTYLAITLMAPPTVLYAYCAKCICRSDSCSHVFPGKLTRLLPARREGPYMLSDYFWTAVPLILLFAFPQYWLWQNKTLLIVFWLFLLAALMEVLLFVCRGCGNESCPICPCRGES